MTKPESNETPTDAAHVRTFLSALMRHPRSRRRIQLLVATGHFDTIAALAEMLAYPEPLTTAQVRAATDAHGRIDDLTAFLNRARINPMLRRRLAETRPGHLEDVVAVAAEEGLHISEEELAGVMPAHLAGATRPGSRTRVARQRIVRRRRRMLRGVLR